MTQEHTDNHARHEEGAGVAEDCTVDSCQPDKESALRAAALDIESDDSLVDPNQAVAKRNKQTKILGCIALCFALILGVSLWALASSNDSLSLQSVSSQEQQVQGTDTSDTKSEEHKIDSRTNSNESENQSAEQPKSESQGEGAQGSSSSASSSASAQSGQAKGASSSSASADTSSSSGATSDSSSSATQPSDSATTPSQPTPSPEPAPQSQTITVTASVDASSVGGFYVGPVTVSFNPGATAYDALVATGVSPSGSYSKMGLYVYSINGLAEKQHGPLSGWMYYVNGAYVNHSCDSCYLKDGDVVTWFYTTGE